MARPNNQWIVTLGVRSLLARECLFVTYPQGSAEY